MQSIPGNGHSTYAPIRTANTGPVPYLVSRSEPAGNRSLANQSDETGAQCGEANIGDAERAISVVGGGILAVAGVARGSLTGLLTALSGGALIYRGLTGWCHLYSLMGVSTACGNQCARK